jgi:hypothetical protein
MTDAPKTRWTTMLNQARAFMEHDPHGAIGRCDEVLAETAGAPSSAPDVREVRTRAQALRAQCTEAYARFQAEAARREVAYRERIQRELAGGRG